MILSLLVVTGCSINGKNPTGSGDEPSKTNLQMIEMANLPEYFEFVDCIDENTLVGLTRNKPFIYDIGEQKSRILSDNLYWNLRLSPDKKLIAFNNETGLGLLEVATGKEMMIYEENDISREEFHVNEFMWSADSQKLLLRADKEIGFKYRVLSLSDKSMKPLVDGLYREAAWVTPEKILFKEGYTKSKEDNEYMGDLWREDLVIYDFGTNTFTKLTDVNDREYFSLIAVLGNDVYLNKMMVSPGWQVLNQQLIKLNIKENKLINVTSVDSSVIAMKGPNKYLTGKNERYDGSNKVIDLNYHLDNISYDLGIWLFDSGFPEVFLFEKSVVISSSRMVAKDQYNNITVYRSMLYRLEG